MLTVSLLVIMLLNLADVVTDITLNVPIWHVLEEALIVLLAGVLAVFLIYDMRKRTHSIIQLRHTVKTKSEQLSQMTSQFKSAKRRYFSEINKQFTDWKLTESEKDVALLLLKGLSLQEIASVRNTKDKTVRQQASSIYSKAGLEGRHSLSAWFFEDLLEVECAA